MSPFSAAISSSRTPRAIEESKLKTMFTDESSTDEVEADTTSPSADDAPEGLAGYGDKREPEHIYIPLPRNPWDENALRYRWYMKKRARWDRYNYDTDFAVSAVAVLDHELRELEHDYWGEGPDKCPSMAPEDAGICPQDHRLAREMLALRDREGLPIIEILGVDDLRRLGWQVSEDAIGLVCWYRTEVPSGECVDDCGEPRCSDPKSTAPTIRRVAQMKLLTGKFGRWQKRPNDTPDDRGLGRHFEWVDKEIQPEGYVWHRKSVGSCAWVDLTRDDKGPVVLTEGLKKGLVAYLRNVSVIVLASVTQGGTGKDGRLADIIDGGSGRYELGQPILDLLKPHERAIWAYDGDVVAKPAVRKALADSMASATLKLGLDPEFVVFPVGEKTKGALDSVLLTSQRRSAWVVIDEHLVAVGSSVSMGRWLTGPRAEDVVDIVWTYLNELHRRDKRHHEASDGLGLLLGRVVDAERAKVLMAPYDEDALARRRRDQLQAHLDSKYVLVNVADGLTKVMLRDGSRLVRPVTDDTEQRAVERDCFSWWSLELGSEPSRVNFGEDVKRFQLRHRPEWVSPISRPGDTGLTRWIMPEPRPGAFPNTNQILGRLVELDETGKEVPLSDESRRCTLAFIGGIFAGEKSRQVGVARGDGGDGKGLLAKLVASAFGGLEGGYTVALAVADQMVKNDNRFWAHPLMGKYFCALLDCKRHRVLEDERMRMLTGGDALPVEVKGGDTFNAPNHTRWWINANVTLEITGQRADLSRVFPMLFKQREVELVTDAKFEAAVLAEIHEFMHACLEAYRAICPDGGDVPLTPGLQRVRNQMVGAGEAELEAFADKHLVFEKGAMMPGTDLTELIENEAPRSWEKSQKTRFRQYLERRLGHGAGTCRLPDGLKHRGKDTFHGWTGVRRKTWKETIAECEERAAWQTAVSAEKAP
jgi:hypothetical protein